jgi:hypothetical protein
MVLGAGDHQIALEPTRERRLFGRFQHFDAGGEHLGDQRAGSDDQGVAVAGSGGGVARNLARRVAAVKQLALPHGLLVLEPPGQLQDRPANLGQRAGRQHFLVPYAQHVR